MCLACMGLTVSSRVLAVPFELKRIAGIVLVALAVMAAVLWADDRYSSDMADTFTWVTAAKALGLSVVLVLLWLGVLRRDERSAMAAWAVGHLRSRGQ
jgi:hypothetical protein